MTRIGAGAMEPNYALHYPGDLVGTALQRAKQIMRGHRVILDMPDSLPMVRLDPVLFEQVLFNLLDNAAKYAPPQTAIKIHGRREGQAVLLSVEDEGPAFRRTISKRSSTASTGSARPIRCRRAPASVLPSAAASSRPWAAPSPPPTGRKGEGAVFTIRMPLPAAQPLLGDEP